MSKYKVTIVSKVYNYVDVEAANEDEAWDKAENLVGEVNLDKGVVTEQEVYDVALPKKKLVKIGNWSVTNAKGFVYDGCHKIYIVYSKEDLAEAKRFGYDKVLPMNDIEATYRDSCPLRFIQRFGDFTDVVSQTSRCATFTYSDKSKTTIINR